MDRGVRLGALPADAVDVSRGTRGHNFLDLAEAESGLQAAGEADRLLGLALGHIPDGGEGGVNHVHRKADRMRELGIQQQEFGDTQRAQFGRVGFAIGFKRGTRFQQADPLDVILALDCLIEGMREASEMGADEASECVSALDEATMRAPSVSVLCVSPRLYWAAMPAVSMVYAGRSAARLHSSSIRRDDSSCEGKKTRPGLVQN